MKPLQACKLSNTSIPLFLRANGRISVEGSSPIPPSIQCTGLPFTNSSHIICLVRYLVDLFEPSINNIPPTPGLGSLELRNRIPQDTLCRSLVMVMR